MALLIEIIYNTLYILFIFKVFLSCLILSRNILYNVYFFSFVFLAEEVIGTRPGFKIGEVFLVLMVLAGWVSAFAMFLHYWAKIRFTLPNESRFQRSYKNLHTIKIVKKNTDMVIYKNYTKELAKTMIAREKRLQRMSTMPNIKLNEPGKEQFNYKHVGLRIIPFGVIRECINRNHPSCSSTDAIERFRTLPRVPTIQLKEPIPDDKNALIMDGIISLKQTSGSVSESGIYEIQKCYDKDPDIIDVEETAPLDIKQEEDI